MLEIKPDIDLMHTAKTIMLVIFITSIIAALTVIGVKAIIKKINKH